MKAEDPVPVTVLIPQHDVISATVMVPCRLESSSEAVISTIGYGRVLRINASIGDTVLAGDPLMELSTDQQYRSSVSASAAGITAARTSVDNADSDLLRAKRLFEEGAISLSEYEMAGSRRAAAEAFLMNAIATYQSARSMEGSGRINAPFDGIVARVFVREGSIASGPLISISTGGVMKAELFVAERHLHGLSEGLPVFLSTSHYPGVSFTGTIISHSSAVDPVSGLVSVIVSFSNTSGILRSGMTGTVTVAIQTSENTVVLPQRVLRGIDGSSWEAVLLKDGKARIIPVEVGISNGSRLEIIHGVALGDSVIDLGHHLVDDGTIVRVVER